MPTATARTPRSAARATLHDALFWTSRRGSDGRTQIVCELCPRLCVLHDGQVGGCGVRKAIGTKLFAMTYARPCAMHVDPIEKKPLFHAFPGARIFSIATIGCNLFCDFCQNWEISKDRWDDDMAQEGQRVAPEDVVAYARKAGCDLIAFTYTEPTVFYEYALDIATLAKKEGIGCVIVSNGYTSEAATRAWAPYLLAANIDVKGSKEYYRKRCKVPDHDDIKKTILLLKELGVHVELTNLLIPGENDSDEELLALATWIATHVGRATPLHLSAFHPDYKMSEKESTPASTLLRARSIAKKHLDYVYIGNVPGERNDTHCPSCGAVVIERPTYEGVSRLKEGKCPECGVSIPGRFVR